MGRAAKAKVSVTLSADLLAEIDEYAKRSGIGNRSRVIEAWLRRAARSARAAKLERDTIDYYERLTVEAVDEDAEWAAASGAAFGRLGLD